MSGPVRSQTSASGKDMTPLKCVCARTAKLVCSATEKPRSDRSGKTKKMNFLRHMISLHKHNISKRAAHLLAYEEEMREDHELFELAIEIRRDPRCYRVKWLSDEWYMIQELIGVRNSELEYELEKRDDEAKLEHIKLAKEIYQLKYVLEELRIARNRLTASKE